VIGEIISHYRIVSKLGAGGMGEVYLAEDTTLDRQVALKFLPESMWDNGDAKERLVREAKAASRLDHPNIVTIHGIEEINGRLFIVMAYVNGTTIDKYIAANDRMADTISDLARQITDGLQHAHESGIIHRDLKPGNILVDDRGRARILDFGLARLHGASRLTQAGATVGTLAYSPPEVIRGEDAEQTSDIYSLGVVLYQLLTGELPFDASHDAALLYSILNEEPRPLLDSVPALPESLRTIVVRCLDKRPDGRFQNCGELMAALHNGQPVPVSSSVRIRVPAVAPSIAVLPFANRSAGADDEYFSDGLADELLNVLAKIRGLRVAAATSSSQFKGTGDDIATIGRKLNVATLLEGSVRKAGNRVRISVQLVKVSDGYHLWSETYDRTLDDIFAVQDDIAQSVVKELRATLLGEEPDSHNSSKVREEVAEAVKGRTRDPEVQRLLLLARHFNDRHSPEDASKAIGYVKQALALDPEFAVAWAELAGIYSRQADFCWVPKAEGIALARQAVDHALSIEPNLALGHLRRLFVQLFFDWDWEGARASVRRIADLAPDSKMALTSAAMLARTEGRLDDANKLYLEVCRLDPLNAGLYDANGFVLHCGGRFAEAQVSFQKALELAPQRTIAHAYVSLALLAQGRGEDAYAEAMQEPQEGYRLWALAIVQNGLGNQTESDKAVSELIAKHSDTMAYQIAEVHGARGERDLAFQWLERAYEERDTGLCTIKVSRYFHSLRIDPRWATFLEKMGFES